jgi:hypothetical protein
MDVNNKYKQLQSINGNFAIFRAGTEKKDKNKIFEVYKWFHSEEVITELYLNCMEFPPMDGMLLKTAGKGMKTGWEEFSKFIPHSVASPLRISTDVSGQPTIVELVNKVWAGNMTTEECLKQYTKIMNDGKAKYQEFNPDYNPDIAINPSWDVKEDSR